MSESWLVDLMNANRARPVRGLLALPPPPLPPPPSPREPVKRDWLRLNAGPNLTCAEVMATVIGVTGVTEREMKSPRRLRRLVRARAIYYACAREYTIASFPVIGRRVGGKDHSTVIHGAQIVASDPDRFQPELGMVRAKLARLVT